MRALLHRQQNFLYTNGNSVPQCVNFMDAGIIFHSYTKLSLSAAFSHGFLKRLIGKQAPGWPFRRLLFFVKVSRQDSPQPDYELCSNRTFYPQCQGRPLNSKFIPQDHSKLSPIPFYLLRRRPFCPLPPQTILPLLHKRPFYPIPLKTVQLSDTKTI